MNDALQVLQMDTTDYSTTPQQCCLRGGPPLPSISPGSLCARRPGEEAGHAVWSILNGTVNPSGRSAHTWPFSIGQVKLKEQAVTRGQFG